MHNLRLPLDALAVDGVVGKDDFIDGFASEGVAGLHRDAPENSSESPPADLFAHLVVSPQCFAHYSLVFPCFLSGVLFLIIKRKLWVVFKAQY